MKQTLILFLIALGVVFSGETMAQKKKKKKKKSKKESSSKSSGGSSKAELKKWDKKKKEMSASKFKEMYEEYNTMKGESAGLKRQIAALKKQISGTEEMLSSKNQELEQIQAEMQKLKEECENKTGGGGNGGDAPCDEQYNTGVVYRVQIGAFRNKDLTKYQSKGNFWAEDTDGVKKYTIGNFRDYWEADAFKKYLREMGVKDAWIVAYEDGERKDIKEVLEASGGAAPPAGGGESEEAPAEEEEEAAEDDGF